MDEDDILIESSRLLPLTSEDSDEALKRITDLNVAKPMTASPVNAVGRTKRKIRLKRRDRNNRLTSSGNGHGFLSDTSVDRSDCFCRPRSSAGYVRRRFVAPQCASVVVMTVVMVVGAVFALGYVAFRLQGQISTLAMHLEAVIEEKRVVSDDHRQLQAQFESIVSKQTSLVSNLTSLAASVAELNSDLESINVSVSGVLKSFESAPALQSLPNSVLQLQTELAGIGSRVAELESGLETAQAEVVKNADRLNKTLEAVVNKTARVESSSSHRPREAEQGFIESVLNRTAQAESKLTSLESKFKDFAISMTEQLKNQEKRDLKSWELLSQLQDNVQNVSAKAMSSQVLCAGNQQKLEKFETEFRDFVESSRDTETAATTTTTTATPTRP